MIGSYDVLNTYELVIKDCSRCELCPYVNIKYRTQHSFMILFLSVF